MIGQLPSFFKPPHAIVGLPPHSPVLLALSGGADSSALLHLLCLLREKHHFPLYAAHVNHNIRGESFGNEALRDEEFCRRICLECGVELFVESVDVPKLAEKSGQSLETAAREARYAFFAELMREKSIKILVTAHNADDNFETQLFNLCRGCGIEGLCGIPESRPFKEADGIVARPILSATKREIFELCQSEGIEYVTDSTNSLDDCIRNKLRLNIIPQLKEIFTSPERSGARLATYATEDSDFLAAEAEKLLQEFEGGIDCPILCDLHPSIAKRAIKAAFKRLSEETLEGTHIESVFDFAKCNKNGRLSLPDGITAVFEGGKLFFTREQLSETEPIEYEILLSSGITYIEGTPFAILLANNCDDMPPEGYAKYASASVTASAPLYARNRREGDRILDGGMHKKIKKLMCDKKVPVIDRNSLPLIFSGDQLIYAPLCAVSDGAKAKKNKFDCNISVYKKI